VEGKETLTAYNLGRNLSQNTHHSDSAIVMQRVYEVDPEKGQIPVCDRLLTTQADELSRCAGYLGEIKRVIEAKDWTPKPEPPASPEIAYLPPPRRGLIGRAAARLTLPFL
jgi:hypothetical protein